MIDQDDRIHGQIVELLSPYIDDEVTAEERGLVEAHLATCTSCAQDLDSLRQTVALLGKLPPVAAPRPFTLREADVRPVRGPGRPGWWQTGWLRGLAGAAAVLVFALVVGAVMLLGRGGMVGAPAAPAQLAMQQAPTASEPASEKAIVETVVVEAETVVEEEQEMLAAAEAAEAATPVEATARREMMLEAPAEEVPPEEKAFADEGEMPATELPRAAAGAAPPATPVPAPLSTPALVPSPPPLLLEVEDLSLEVEPGIIRARGRVPLPQGRKLSVVLWRDGQPTEWGTPESRQLTVEASGWFDLVLTAQADTPDMDLFAAEPAHYEIRMRPVDPPAAVEIRIPFDTYGPPSPEPGSTP
ncbi:MAG: hypothetical protein Kow0063_07360 [Anaerolineae bacterium]